MKASLKNIVTNQVQQKPAIYPRVRATFEQGAYFSVFSEGVNGVHAEPASLIDLRAGDRVHAQVPSVKEVSQDLSFPGTPLKKKHSFEGGLQHQENKDQGSETGKPSGMEATERNSEHSSAQGPAPFDGKFDRPKETRTFERAVDEEARRNSPPISSDSDGKVKKVDGIPIGTFKKEKPPMNFSGRKFPPVNSSIPWNRDVEHALSKIKSAEVREREKESAPVVNVTIGRIDVRAVPRETVNREMSKPRQQLSFEEFLRQRNRSKS